MTATASFALDSLLRRIHQRGQLLPQLRDAATEQLAVDAARAAGLSVPDADLQAAADQFRQRNGLSAGADARAWLQNQLLTPLDLQNAVECDLLIERFKDHLAAEHGPEHFAVHPARFGRARLRLFVAASEGEARERLAQIEEEGRDFAALAQQHSLHVASHATGGELGEVFRGRFPEVVGDAIWAARPGEIVGPFAGEGGYCLFLVEGTSPPSLEDAGTAAIVRGEVFEDWRRKRLAEIRLDLSGLIPGRDDPLAAGVGVPGPEASDTMS